MRLYVLHRFPQDHRRGFLLFIRFQMLLYTLKWSLELIIGLILLFYCCVAWPGGVRSLARVGPVFRNIVPPPASACGLCCTPSSPAFSALGFTFALCEGFSERDVGHCLLCTPKVCTHAPLPSSAPGDP